MYKCIFEGKKSKDHRKKLCHFVMTDILIDAMELLIFTAMLFRLKALVPLVMLIVTQYWVATLSII